ncbi:MAG TPA: hypothetical protein PLF40_10215 [Kofleriaceae bacterium]|nr:hypothetical protein [Kofleriaceae bacterium]
MIRNSLVMLVAPTVVIAAWQSQAVADCAMPAYAGDVLTTRVTKLPADGGILVGWKYDAHATTPASGDASDQPTWTISNGKANANLKLKRVSLAPGLSVYQPAPAPGTLTLADGKGTALGTFTLDPKAAANAMVAPVALSVALSETPSRRGNNRHVLATFKDAAPPEAVAVIVYQAPVQAKSATAKGAAATTAPVAISFVRIPDSHDQIKEVQVFRDAGYCGVLQPGARPPAANERVAFAWVDAFGRRSPLSAPVVAKAADKTPTP